MSTIFHMDNSEKAELIMPRTHAERLKTTCFRGKRCRKAGNFSAWNNFAEFLQDVEARELMQVEIKKLIDLGETNQHHRIELEFSHDVGWDSCIDKNDLTQEDLEACEERPLNKHSSALFVKEGVVDSPRTEFVTMVAQLIFDGHWKLIVRTLYPGADCGRLSGNLTETQNLVFLSWDNPGE